jgi:hypothetical protein
MLRVVGRFMAPASFAVADAVVLQAERDELSRVAQLARTAMAITFFAIGLAVGKPGFARWMLIYVAGVAVIDGVDGARRSTEAAAGWIFWTSPVAARRLISGMQVGIAFRTLLVPVALAAVSLVLDSTPGQAVVSVAMLLAALRLVGALIFALRPAMPLSESERTIPAVLAFVLAFGVTGACSALIWLVRAGAELGGWAGVAGGLAVVGAVVVLALLVESLAAWRLRAVEHRA